MRKCFFISSVNGLNSFEPGMISFYIFFGSISGGGNAAEFLSEIFIRVLHHIHLPRTRSVKSIRQIRNSSVAKIYGRRLEFLLESFMR